jgi:hypothetical protein
MMLSGAFDKQTVDAAQLSPNILMIHVMSCVDLSSNPEIALAFVILGGLAYFRTYNPLPRPTARSDSAPRRGRLVRPDPR